MTHFDEITNQRNLADRQLEESILASIEEFGLPLAIARLVADIRAETDDETIERLS